MKAVYGFASKPFFLLLLPLFFVLHGYVENSEAMRFSEALGLLGQYVLATVLLAGIGWLLFRSFSKAALLAFALLFFQLFFGVAHDGLKKLLPGSFIVQYSFILPAVLVGVIVLLFFLKRSKRGFSRFFTYLNVLFLLLILMEIPGLLKASSGPSGMSRLSGTTVCDTCQKPDIYLIIADEYADSASLQQIFGFNNGSFQSALRERGFHLVTNSKSNYNYTPFSVASLLQMDYLTGIEGRNQSLADKNRCYDLINNSGLWLFLQQHGYEIKNHSLFHLANIPTPAPQNYIRIGKAQVVAQTFLSRINRDLRYHLAEKFKIKSEVNRILYFMQRCNELLLEGLLAEPGDQSVRPKFVYAHLSMPHYPYYFRKDGKPNPPEMLSEGNQVRKPEYIEYLQYSNKVYLNTIDSILQRSKQPPVILFMGDHGFREFPDGFEKYAPFYFMNINAVYLPNSNSAGFYEGISGVNQFRVLLNTVFDQKLPLLKDSTSLLYE